MRRGWALLWLAAALPVAAQRYQPPQHVKPPPPILAGVDAQMLADGGVEVEHDRPTRDALEEHRRLDRALVALAPQRKGVVDAYVVAIGLDSDPVFGREAREAAKVLSRRYGAVGCTIVLAGSDGTAASPQPRGSPGNIAAALARIAELADPAEDVLIVYMTSHGAPIGVVYNDGDEGFGAISPYRLWRMLNDLGLDNRLMIVSACYAGVFVPLLSSDTGIVLTAADAEHSSFGCQADGDWTYYGDALVNHALRRPQPLAAAIDEANTLIAGWERKDGLTPSNPQAVMRPGASHWLAALDARVPQATTPPVGRPAIDSRRDPPAGQR